MSTSIPNTINRAIRYIGEYRFDHALATVANLLATAPRNPSAIFLHGICLGLENKDEQAHKEFARALAIAPRDSMAHLLRGYYHHYYHTDSQLVDAVLHYSEAIRADSSNVQALFLRGVAHFQQRSYQPAIRDFAEILEHSNYSDYSRVYVFRGCCYLGEGDRDMFQEEWKHVDWNLVPHWQMDAVTALWKEEYEVKFLSRRTRDRLLYSERTGRPYLIKAKVRRAFQPLPPPDYPTSQVALKGSDTADLVAIAGEAILFFSSESDEARYARTSELQCSSDRALSVPEAPPLPAIHCQLRGPVPPRVETTLGTHTIPVPEKGKIDDSDGSDGPIPLELDTSPLMENGVKQIKVITDS